MLSNKWRQRKMKYQNFLTLAPIWLPHWPAWMWIISLITWSVMSYQHIHPLSWILPYTIYMKLSQKFNLSLYQVLDSSSLLFTQKDEHIKHYQFLGGRRTVKGNKYTNKLNKTQNHTKSITLISVVTFEYHQKSLWTNEDISKRKKSKKSCSNKQDVYRVLRWEYLYLRGRYFILFHFFFWQTFWGTPKLTDTHSLSTYERIKQEDRLT